MDRDIYRRIKKLRVKLEKAIEEKGLDSDEVRELSDKMDEFINEYEKSIKTIEFPQCSSMEKFYEESYSMLKKITADFGKFPNVQEWNYLAEENKLLSHSSLEYISKLNWNDLRIKVERELKFKVVKKDEKFFKKFF